MSGRDWNRHTVFFTFESGKWLNLPTLQFLELAVPNNLTLMMLSDCSCKLKLKFTCDKLCLWSWYHYQHMRWHENLWSSSALHMQIVTSSGTVTSVLYNITMWVGREREHRNKIFFTRKSHLENRILQEDVIRTLSENTFWITVSLVLTYHTKIWNLNQNAAGQQ